MYSCFSISPTAAVVDGPAAGGQRVVVHRRGGAGFEIRAAGHAALVALELAVDVGDVAHAGRHRPQRAPAQLLAHRPARRGQHPTCQVLDQIKGASGNPRGSGRASRASRAERCRASWRDGGS